MEGYRFTAGSTPLLVGMPHAGTILPEDIAASMTPAALVQMDTGWHVDRLYDFAHGLGASTLASMYSRYVIDMNRSPEGRNLFSGKDNTGLCPVQRFDYEPLYRHGMVPSQDDIEARLDVYWHPYHERLASELARLRDLHGVAVLFDAHTIRSETARFFKGPVPDLNLKSGGGTCASPDLVRRLQRIFASVEDYSHVVDGEYKGGYIVRHYGAPDNGIHALQLELCQFTYMDETTFTYVSEKAERIREILKALLSEILIWVEENRRSAKS